MDAAREVDAGGGGLGVQHRDHLGRDFDPVDIDALQLDVGRTDNGEDRMDFPVGRGARRLVEIGRRLDGDGRPGRRLDREIVEIVDEDLLDIGAAGDEDRIAVMRGVHRRLDRREAAIADLHEVAESIGAGGVIDSLRWHLVKYALAKTSGPRGVALTELGRQLVTAPAYAVRSSSVPER